MDKIEIVSFKKGVKVSTIDMSGWTVDDVKEFYAFQKRRGYTCRMKRRLNGLKKGGKENGKL